MSSTTTELKLFKYNTATDGKEVFSIDTAMNANWDKIDAFATAIKDLSNLSTKGEKRFSDLSTAIGQKLSAEVSLAENGYIKFNNNLKICWGHCSPQTFIGITLPITYSTFFNVIHGGGDKNSITWVISEKYNMNTINIGSRGTTGYSWCHCYYVTVGI